MLKRHCFDPHWSRRRGAVMAWEQLSLFGLIIVEKRRVNYAAVDPVEARRIFILEALVRGELNTRAAFMTHNEKIRQEVEELEHKRRKRDVLADEHAQYDFFDARLSDSVNSAASFEQWLTGLDESERGRLYLGHDVLMRDGAGSAPEELFPDRLTVAGQKFPLEYHFEPGHERDGVTLSVPLELLNILDPGRLQWLVPGLLRDKLVALIKQLPKPLRRSLTPAPSFADALMERLSNRQNRPMIEECATALQNMTGLSVSAADLDEASIADHYRFNICVIDENAELIAQGRDLSSLQETLGHVARRRFMDNQGEAYRQDGETSWVFGKLERTVTTADGNTAWPALVDQETAVGLRLFDTYEDAALSHMDGVRRLLALNLSDKLLYLSKHHGLSREALLVWSALGSSQQLIADLVWKSLAETAGDLHQVLDKDAYEALCLRVRNELGKTALRFSDLLNEALAVYGRLSARLSDSFESRWPDASSDVASQLDDLVYPGFLADLGPGRLVHYSRYLRGIEERLEQLEQNPGRDRQRQAQIQPWWDRYTDALERGALYDEQLDAFRWLLEEFRVSLFAQKLGTDGKVSEKRLAQAWRITDLGQ